MLISNLLEWFQDNQRTCWNKISFNSDANGTLHRLQAWLWIKVKNKTCWSNVISTLPQALPFVRKEGGGGEKNQPRNKHFNLNFKPVLHSTFSSGTLWEETARRRGYTSHACCTHMRRVFVSVCARYFHSSVRKDFSNICWGPCEFRGGAMLSSMQSLMARSSPGVNGLKLK